MFAAVKSKLAPGKSSKAPSSVPQDAPVAVKKAAKSQPVSLGKDALVESDDDAPVAKVASKVAKKKKSASSSSLPAPEAKSAAPAKVAAKPVPKPAKEEESPPQPPRPPVAPDLLDDVDYFAMPSKDAAAAIPKSGAARNAAPPSAEMEAAYFASAPPQSRSKPAAAAGPPRGRVDDRGYLGDTQQTVAAYPAGLSTQSMLSRAPPAQLAGSARSPPSAAAMQSRAGTMRSRAVRREASATSMNMAPQSRDVTKLLRPAEHPGNLAMPDSEAPATPRASAARVRQRSVTRENDSASMSMGSNASMSDASEDSSIDVAPTRKSAGPMNRKASYGNAWAASYQQQQQLQQQQPQQAVMPPPPPQPVTAGRFRIDYSTELGSGGFGVVYKAFDTQEGDFVAVKETHVGREDMAVLEKAMKAEFSILTKLRHPNVVQVLHYAAEDGRSRIFMEWMPMGSVHSILRGTGFRLHERVIRRYAFEALQGLAYLHGKGILHRDIKPANMLVSGTATVKISDFGTSREIMVTSAQSTQNVVGTPCYLSAEAITEGRYTTGSDVWALACSIVEMATGQPPWSELPRMKRQPVPLMFHIGSTAPPNHHPAIPAHLSDELRAILEACFAYDSAARPGVAELLATPYFAAAVNREALPPSAEPTADYDAKLLAAGEAVEGDEARATFAQTVTLINTFGAATTMSSDGRGATSSVYSEMAMPVRSDDP